MKIKEKILELRKLGYSYGKIGKELGCSRSLISYHCSPGQKQKTLNRTKKRRLNQHPLVTKIEAFNKKYKSSKISKENNHKTINNILYKRIISFCMKSNKTNNKEYGVLQFSVEDILNKIGENPVCALTGRKIDLSQPKTYQLDHIVPRSRGGDNSLDNCQLVCKDANLAKNGLLIEDFIQLCKDVVNNFSDKEKA